MRIDISEPSLVALFEKGQVGLIRTEFMRKDDVIADLVEQNASLAAENERLRSASFVTAVPSEQYERVTKAGDAFLGTYLFASVKGLVSQDIATKVIEEWQAAKEGRDAK